MSLLSSGTCFTNGFYIEIQIQLNFGLNVNLLMAAISQRNFAHATTAQLSCHVQKFVTISSLQFRHAQSEISIEFEFWWKDN